MFSVSDVLGKVADIFNPFANLVDNVHTSTEEKLELKNKLVSLQNEVVKGQMDLLAKAIDLEAKALQAQQAVLNAEINSDSWLAKNWRPATMVTFVSVVTLHSLGFIEMSETMSQSYFSLVKIGLGGYIASRGVEKAAPSIAMAIRK